MAERHSYQISTIMLFGKSSTKIDPQYRMLRPPGGVVMAVARPNSDVVAFAYERGHVLIWPDSIVLTPTQGDSMIVQMSFRTDGTQLVVLDSRMRLSVWELTVDPPICLHTATLGTSNQGRVTAMSILSNGEHAFLGTERGALLAFDLASLSMSPCVFSDLTSRPILEIHPNPMHPALCLILTSTEAFLYDFVKKEKVATINVLYPTAAAYRSDGQLLVIGSERGILTFVDGVSGMTLANLTVYGAEEVNVNAEQLGPITRLTLTHDDQICIQGGTRLADAVRGVLVWQLPQRQDHATDSTTKFLAVKLTLLDAPAPIVAFAQSSEALFLLYGQPLQINRYMLPPLGNPKILPMERMPIVPLSGDAGENMSTNFIGWCRPDHLQLSQCLTEAAQYLNISPSSEHSLHQSVYICKTSEQSLDVGCLMDNFTFKSLGPITASATDASLSPDTAECVVIQDNQASLFRSVLKDHPQSGNPKAEIEDEINDAIAELNLDKKKETFGKRLSKWTKSSKSNAARLTQTPTRTHGIWSKDFDLSRTGEETPVTCHALSAIGFLAVSWIDSLVVVDLRGPQILYDKSKISAEKMLWSVCRFRSDPQMRPRLFCMGQTSSLLSLQKDSISSQWSVKQATIKMSGIAVLAAILCSKTHKPLPASQEALAACAYNDPNDPENFAKLLVVEREVISYRDDFVDYPDKMIKLASQANSATIMYSQEHGTLLGVSLMSGVLEIYQAAKQITHLQRFVMDVKVFSPQVHMLDWLDDAILLMDQSHKTIGVYDFSSGHRFSRKRIGACKAQAAWSAMSLLITTPEYVDSALGGPARPKAIVRPQSEEPDKSETSPMIGRTSDALQSGNLLANNVFQNLKDLASRRTEAIGNVQENLNGIMRESSQLVENAQRAAQQATMQQGARSFFKGLF